MIAQAAKPEVFISCPNVLGVSKGFWPFIKPRYWVMRPDFDRCVRDAPCGFGSMWKEVSNRKEADRLAAIAKAEDYAEFDKRAKEDASREYLWCEEEEY